jgi:multiple sugar transport system permease protein
MLRRFRIGRALFWLLLAIIVLYLLFPFYWALRTSISPDNEIYATPVQYFPAHPTLTNYGNVFSSNDFLIALRNSAIVGVAVTVLALVLGASAAYALARFRFRGADSIAFTILSFRFAPPLLVIIPLALIYQSIGLYNTFQGLIWVYQLITLPLIVWIVRGYFEDVSSEVEFACRLDGYSWWRTFIKISLPLARPGIAAAALLAFIYAWNNFIFALVLGSSGVQPVTVAALSFMTASGLQYGQMAAAMIISVLPILALAIYAQRFLVRGLSMGSIKG